MEVKVYTKKDGAVAVTSHTIPPLVGDSVTREDDGATVTASEADVTSDVVDKVEISAERGVVLTRRVVRRKGAAWASKPANGTSSMIVVTPRELARATRVEVDGESVWEPGEAGGEPQPQPARAADGPRGGGRALADGGAGVPPEDLYAGMTEDDAAELRALVSAYLG